MKYNESFLNRVVDAYLECAIWVRFDLDENINIDDIDLESANKANKDCKLFLDSIPENNLDPSQIGHDFWLTRNGHGAGFWDRYMGIKEVNLRPIVKELGEKLTEICETMGKVEIYLCDEGKVVIS